MTPTLVTAVEESSGKTAILLALALIARDRGRDVGYMKPKGTRLTSPAGKTLDEDPVFAADVLGLDADVADLEPVVYSPTFVAAALRSREDPGELKREIRGSYDRLSEGRDAMFVEGGGTITTGGVIDLTDADVAALLDARVVLVAGYGDPRDVDDVLAAADRVGDRLAGVVFNAVPEGEVDAVLGDVSSFLEARGIPVLGVVPRDRDLAGVTVARLAEALDAEVLTDAPMDGVVERFAVGAMGADAALRYLRRVSNAAVITGGDRAEIQTAAIESPGVECLVLTGGLRPPGAVLGAAEERGVPVLLVSSETLATIERAEAVVRGGRTRDAFTVERMRALLEAHADVDALLGA